MRTRGPVGAWLIAGTFLLACGVGAVVAGRPVVRAALIYTMEQSGVPVRSLRIRSLGLREGEFGRIALGTEAGPEVESARAVWTVPRLLRGRVDRLILRHPRLTIAVRDGGLAVEGVPAWGSGSSGGGTVPFRRIDALDGVLTVKTQFGDVSAMGDASVVADPSGAMRLERALVRRAALPIAHGTVSITDTEYRESQPVEAVLQIDAVDLAAVLAFLDVEGLSGTGELDGNVPVKIDTAGVQISGGQVSATGPGTIKYTGRALQGAGMDKSVTERIDLVRAALADFRYKSLMLTLERTATGESTLIAKLEGTNPAVLEGHPFAINLRLDANFDKLATVLMEGYAAMTRLLRAR